MLLLPGEFVYQHLCTRVRDGGEFFEGSGMRAFESLGLSIGRGLSVDDGSLERTVIFPG